MTTPRSRCRYWLRSAKQKIFSNGEAASWNSGDSGRGRSTDRSPVGDKQGSIAQNARFGSTGMAKVRDGVYIGPIFHLRSSVGRNAQGPMDRPHFFFSFELSYPSRP